MFQPIRKALGPFGGFPGPTGGHGTGDGEQLALDVEEQTARRSPDERFEPGDGPVQPGHGDGQPVVASPIPIEGYDLSHDARLAVGSDI